MPLLGQKKAQGKGHFITDSLTPQSTAEECEGAVASLMKQIKLLASGITGVITEASLQGPQQAWPHLWMKIPPHVNNQCGTVST